MTPPTHTTPDAFIGHAEPTIVAQVPASGADVRISRRVGEMLDNLITVANARDQLKAMLVQAGREPSELDGPAFEPALFTIRISGLDLNGSDTPQNHLDQMCRYAFAWGYRPADVCFERQSGYKLTEPRGLDQRIGAGGARRRKRHAKNYDRKRWLARYEALASGELEVTAVLCHTMDRFARREGTGQMWLDFMEQNKVKMVETRYLEQAPRSLDANGHELYNKFMKDLSDARLYSLAVSGKISDKYDAKALLGEATYGVGNTYGHDAVMSTEFNPRRYNKHGNPYQAGGRVNPAEAEALRFAADYLRRTGNRGGTVKATNGAGYRTRSGGLWANQSLLLNNLASPRMVGYQTRGSWQEHHARNAEETGARKMGEQLIRPCELIEPILNMTVQEWEAMCDVILARKPDRRNPSKWPLSGMGRCGGKHADGSQCRHNMTGLKTGARDPILRCGRQNGALPLCNCGKPGGSCKCLADRIAKGLTHPTINMKLVARVLVEGTLLSYDVQRAARRASELLGEDTALNEQLVQLIAKADEFNGERLRIRNSNNRGLYETEAEFDAEVSDLQRRQRQNDEAIAVLRDRMNLIQGVEVDPESMRAEVEGSMDRLVELSKGVMTGFTVLPETGGSLKAEQRIIIDWVDGCAPSPEAWLALCDELAVERMKHRKAAVRKALGTCTPETSNMIWLLWGQGKAANEIIFDLRALGMPMAKSTQTGNVRDRADMRFVREEVKHLCVERGETYIARANYRGRRKYPLELGRRIYEMCKTGHPYPTIANALNQDNVPHPDGKPWDAQVVYRIYGAECSVRMEKRGRRASTSDETRALAWADAQMGMTHGAIAEKLNRDRVRRWSKKPWTATAVSALLAYERRRLEAEGLIKRGGLLPREFVQTMRDMRDAGATSTEIAAWANEKGIPRRGGNSWDTQAAYDAMRLSSAERMASAAA